MNTKANKILIDLIRAEIDYQHHEKYMLLKENFTLRWQYHFMKNRGTERGFPDDLFLRGLMRMQTYQDIDKDIIDLYMMLSKSVYDAREPYRPIWGTQLFVSASSITDTVDLVEMDFVAVREAILAENAFNQFASTMEPYGFKAILLGSSILLPNSRLLGCVWVHPSDSREGFLISEIKGCRYTAPYAWSSGQYDDGMKFACSII